MGRPSSVVMLAQKRAFTSEATWPLAPPSTVESSASAGLFAAAMIAATMSLSGDTSGSAAVIGARTGID
jgi:hypothetical protein